MINKFLCEEFYLIQIEASCVTIGNEKSFSISMRRKEQETLFVEGTAEEIHEISEHMKKCFIDKVYAKKPEAENE